MITDCHKVVIIEAFRAYNYMTLHRTRPTTRPVGTWKRRSGIADIEFQNGAYVVHPLSNSGEREAAGDH
jgi:hypothetical protein